MLRLPFVEQLAAVQAEYNVLPPNPIATAMYASGLKVLDDAALLGFFVFRHCYLLSFVTCVVDVDELLVSHLQTPTHCFEPFPKSPVPML